MHQDVLAQLVTLIMELMKNVKHVLISVHHVQEPQMTVHNAKILEPYRIVHV